jgi:hypothetical protein
MPKRKSWSEKLEDSKDLPRVEKIEGKLIKRWGTGTVVIPAPMEVNELMRRVPEGKLTTINEKYPGGVEAQRELLEKEGHEVIQKGKRFIVADYEKSLADI